MTETSIFSHKILNKYLLIYISGLVELREPIEFGQSIRPVKLASDCGGAQRGETVIAAGRGQTDMYYYEKHTEQALLHHGFTEVLPPAVCNVSDADWIICTNSIEGQSALHGDSGQLHFACATLIEDNNNNKNNNNNN